MASLENQTVLVTAAAQGIGRAIAQAFSEAGATVWATDINTAKLMEPGSEEKIQKRTLDVRNSKAIDALVAEIGGVDVLVNCAGYVHNGNVLECTESDIDFAFDLNVKSMWRTVNAVLPGMLSNGQGSIINIASVAGSIKGVPSRFAYGLTKAAIIGLTKSIAVDFVSKGIRCNAICPGTVESPSLEERLRAQGDYDKARAGFIARQPIGRLAQPQEIADLAVYLAQAGYTTGQAHIIDGGWTA